MLSAMHWQAFIPPFSDTSVVPLAQLPFWVGILVNGKDSEPNPNIISLFNYRCQLAVSVNRYCT